MPKTWSAWAVREEDRVHAADVVRERLRAQIGGRVDENVADRSGHGAGGRVSPGGLVPPVTEVQQD